MAKITVSDIKPAGHDLFSDSESYMVDLSENELDTTHGGLTWLVTVAVGTQVILQSLDLALDTIQG